MTKESLDLAQGLEALSLLIKNLEDDKDLDLNEADTRHRFIDCLIHDCLGWARESTRLEKNFEGDYSDYELGQPSSIVIEAKRAGLNFDVPVQKNGGLIRSIQSLCKNSPAFKIAFDQAQSYCSQRGIGIGVVCNIKQIIIFLGIRKDGPPAHGHCLVLDGWGSLVKNFKYLWDVLSPSGVDFDKLADLLKESNNNGLPLKLSSKISGYPDFRYASTDQQNLKMLSDLLIEDAPNTPTVLKRFYSECYCESGALAQEALVGKNILSNRYAAMFSPSENAPILQSINSKEKTTLGLSDEIIADALGRRPIVIMGDVGVGKTSFVQHLITVRAEDEFKNALFLYIDLGSKANLGQDLRSYFINEIERQLFEIHKVDLNENKFIRGVYHGQLTRFENGIYGALKERAPDTYLLKQIEYLSELKNNKENHIKNCLTHLARGRKKQVIISIDNADQRDLTDQQKAFLAAQDFAANWDAVVFISLRPQTYFTSKSHGSISAYSQRILTVSPPRLDLVLLRRLQFSLDLAEGRLPLEKLEGITIRLDAISLFIKSLLDSLRNNKEIIELLSNITSGNIREALNLIKNFIGSSNVDSDKIIEKMKNRGRYTIPLHEFSKSAIIGEFAHYHAPNSIALNLFDISYPDQKEHFLCCFILGFLSLDNIQKNQNGFIDTYSIFNELQDYGFIKAQIEFALRRLTNKKLIETTERITFNEGLQGLVGDMPLAFRHTTIGSYHIRRWLPTFAYIDAMIVDTPILNDQTRSDIMKNINSFEIEHRFNRCQNFISYLDNIWINIINKPVYFNWPSLKSEGAATFNNVENFIKSKNNK